MRSFIPLIFLSGCGLLIDHAPAPAGWPQLKVIEHRVQWSEMSERCAQYAPVGSIAVGCAIVNLTAQRCDIWLSPQEDSATAQSILEHERMHCAGHDHVGDSTMRDLLVRYSEQIKP